MAGGKFGRSHLPGVLGDRINALPCGAGHNIRLILRTLREVLLFIVLVEWGQEPRHSAPRLAEDDFVAVVG